MEQTTWTDADFEQMSWHDNHVHGLQIEGGENGEGTFALDLDYIVEWLPQPDRTIHFRIAPATLLFENVSDLKIDLDWASVRAGMEPFSIGGIGREKRESPNGHLSWHWTIDVNWPAGLIAFQASGFKQALRGQVITTRYQHLEAYERGAQLAR